jgi:hypothetical protein
MAIRRHDLMRAPADSWWAGLFGSFDEFTARAQLEYSTRMINCSPGETYIRPGMVSDSEHYLRLVPRQVDDEEER